ncbi:MAG: 30S ribosomal protein S17 [Micavibrio sp.]|jgi:small subunit ribosomal protein S17|nr:MAG: 30S ribosomal protein S17 [Micavibrio sp.]
MPKRVMEGKVISNACDKTVTVLVERRVTDALYKKVVRRSAKYAAHDPQNLCQMGDLVTIEETPRISKRKAWVVISGGTGTPQERRENTLPKEKEEKTAAGPKKSKKKSKAQPKAKRKAAVSETEAETAKVEGKKE